MTDVKIKSFADNVENYYFMEILSDKMEVGARNGLIKASKDITKQTKDNIKNPPKTGIKYPNLRVRSSRPGEYPANQTGALRRSIIYQISGTRKAFIGSSKFYAPFLAFGTRRMKKRAFIGTVIKENTSKTYTAIYNEINKELKI